MEQHAWQPSDEQLGRLRSQLALLTTDAFKRSSKSQFWAELWQATDLVLGLFAAMLAAIAAATGLASPTGRIPAAIMALAAAALIAAARFLRSNERYEKNWRRRIAWRVLGQEAQFVSAAEGYPGARSVYDAMCDLLERRVAIMEMGHDQLPQSVLGRNLDTTARVRHAPLSLHEDHELLSDRWLRP